MIQRIKNKINRLGNTKKCYICQNTFSYFLPFRSGLKPSGFINDLEMIGSDIKNFSCPWCMSHDRERHLFMYIDSLSLWKSMGGNVLHFAPERHLSKKIEKQRPKKYIKADLYSNDPDVEKIDITNIPYPEDFFDVVICNHVLEHIENVEKAINELFRVLHKGGSAILQTPYSSILSASFHDKNINTDTLRQRFYGQEDHVRVFGSDLFDRLQKAGFTLHLKHHRDQLPKIDVSKYGVNIKEALILVKK